MVTKKKKKAGMIRKGKIPAFLRALPDNETKVGRLLDVALETCSQSPDQALFLAFEAKTLTEKLEYHHGLGEVFNTLGIIHWFLGDFDATLDYHYKALEIWKILDNTKGIGKSNTGLGNVYARRGNYQIALEYYFKSLTIYKGMNFQEGISSCYNNIAVVYKNLGEYDKSLNYNFKSLRIKEIEKDENGIAYSYNNLGILFNLTKDFKKALEYFKKALKIFEKQGNKSELANVNVNIGKTYASLQKYQKALEYLKTSLELKKELSEKIGMVASLISIGEIYSKRKEYNESITSYQKALEISRETRFREGIGESLWCLGEVYLLMKEPLEAIGFLEKAVKSNKSSGHKENVKLAYKAMSEAYFMLDDYQKAYEFQAQFINLKEDLFNEEKNKVFNEMRAKYEAEKKDLEIEKLNMEQKFLKHTNKELEQFASKAAHDLKEPLRMMSNFSGLLVRRYEDQLDESGKEFLTIIQDASKRMNTLLSNMLEYAKTGIPTGEAKNVNLNDILLMVKSNLQLSIRENDAVIVYDELPVVRASSSNMIQLFQNLISNAIKFRAEAFPVIEISFKELDQFFLFYVRDNGIGIAENQQSHVFDLFHRINPQKDFDGSGIGLATCKRIVENLSGQIKVESKPGEGSIFSFTLPKAETVN